jgi:hypothetical protein
VRLSFLVFFGISVLALRAQNSSAEAASSTTVAPADAAPAAAPAPVIPVEDKRAYGVLPNYRTAELSTPFKPLTAKQKMSIAAKDSFDGAVYPTAAVMSVIYQAEHSNPSFGEGFAGYAKRVGTAFGDQMIGNMMTEGVMPTILHEDPRYFRIGEGSFGHRLWYAARQTIITRTDSNHQIFNFAEWTGNSVAVGISNLYYQDGRTWRDNTERLLVQCGTDTLSNVLKEFWPDVKRHFQKKKD